MPAFDYSLVADIYDKYVTTDLDVRFFLEESNRVKGRVLELMCGTGRLTLPLLSEGVSLTCVDSSPAMLSRLRKKLAQSELNTEVVEQDVVHLSLAAEYELAVIPFNSFEEITATSDQLSSLLSIRRHLTPKGKLIVTLHNPSIRLKQVNGLRHTIGPFPLDESGQTLTLTVREKYDSPTEMVNGYQVFEAHDNGGALLWQRNIRLAFRLVTLQQLKDLAKRAGLTLETVLGDYDGSPFDSATSPFIIGMLRN
jgi:SAM-dependent methyltransferase